MKTSDTKRTHPGKPTIWTVDELQYLQENFNTSTNVQLAKNLNMTLTVVRNKCRELGLKHIEMEYWTEEQIAFLKANYKTMGDTEIAEILQQKWPKKKKWKKQHIDKKREYLGLKRTQEEIFAITSKNSSKGGRSHTIVRNSASKNLTDNYVANTIAWRNKQLQETVLQHPELIELKRNQLKLKRAIDEHSR